MGARISPSAVLAIPISELPNDEKQFRCDMRTHGSNARSSMALFVILLGLLVPAQAPAVGSWSSLVNLAPDSPTHRTGHMLLLSDGTVMVQNYDQPGWFLLTPDSHGSYLNGTWTTIASMHSGRGYYSSVLLTDGRVFVA